MSTLENKIVLIFGGSSGLGFGVAEASLKSLAKTVLIASSNKDRVDKAVKKLTDAKLGPGEIYGLVVDAANEQSIKSLLKSVEAVDHIVFTSGRDVIELKFPAVDISAAKETMDLKFWSVVAVAKYAKFRPGGSLTLTSGTLAIKPVPTLSIVSAGSGALHSLTRGLAVDLAPIRVTVICPGPDVNGDFFLKVRTELLDNLLEEAQEIFQSRVVPSLLVKHIGMPDERPRLQKLIYSV